MDYPAVLPFKVGQMAESRSFKKGFRGAWFRCKIKQLTFRKFGPDCALEFYDFPEEKLSWSRVYQKPERKCKPELILRPQYPPIYKESEVPDASTISEVTVVRNDAWKIGDEVDWFTDDCYWSGRVTKILTKEKVQIDLLPPPAGEGLAYDVRCKDLRPSLDWSIEHGWRVPLSKEGENLRPCARLIKPVDKGPSISNIDGVYEQAKDIQSIAGSSFDSSFSSDTSSLFSLDVDKSKEVTCKSEANTGQFMESIARTSSNSVTTVQVRDALAQTNGDEEENSSGPMKRMRTGGSVPLNSTQSDTLEATFLDLEELVNKVKWLKGILQCENPLSSTRRPAWKFLEHRASSMPK